MGEFDYGDFQFKLSRDRRFYRKGRKDERAKGANALRPLRITGVPCG
jgi:hypothetical protein